MSLHVKYAFLHTMSKSCLRFSNTWGVEMTPLVGPDIQS